MFGVQGTGLVAFVPSGLVVKEDGDKILAADNLG